MDNQFLQAYRNPHQANPPQVIKDCVDGILQEAKRHLTTPPSEWSVLDVGCGSGEYSLELSRHVARVVGVEPELRAVEVARQQLRAGSIKSVEFATGFIEDYRTTQLFDLAISLTTVEHMPDARKSFAHILDLLKPGGVIYLTAPNKLWPIECHYALPFLSWLPLPLADLYLRMMGYPQSYADCSYMRTYRGMKKLFAGLNCQAEFVLPDINNSYIGVGDTNRVRRLVRVLGIALIRRVPAFWTISKAFLMVIRKT